MGAGPQAGLSSPSYILHGNGVTLVYLSLVSGIHRSVQDTCMGTAVLTARRVSI